MKKQQQHQKGEKKKEKCKTQKSRTQISHGHSEGSSGKVAARPEIRPFLSLRMFGLYIMISWKKKACISTAILKRFFRVEDKETLNLINLKCKATHTCAHA